MERPLAGEVDAQVWAEEFVRRVKEKPEIATDEGCMIGWFANAIMAGHDREGRAVEGRLPTEDEILTLMINTWSIEAGDTKLERFMVVAKAISQRLRGK